MNTVQNGKGDTARNNWGPEWYKNYDQINWHRHQSPSPQPENNDPKTRAATSGAPEGKRSRR